jgi:hypothetical protein
VLDNKRLVSEKTNSGYQRDFRQLGMQLSDRLSPSEWAEVYKKLVYWELEINETEGKSYSRSIVRRCITPFCPPPRRMRAMPFSRA